jgi:hypothetical protein
MPKVLITLILLMAFCSITKGQVIDTLNGVERISKDTFNMQDTSNIPHGEERSQSEKQEPIVEEPAVVKDSTRLALESLTRTAVRKSAILPGWGQLQNGRWWKVPIVVGGFVGIGYSYNFARQHYRKFLAEAQYRAVNTASNEFLYPEFANYPSDWIIQAKDFYRRNRDLSILAGVGFYAIQLIDAYVDAKFFRYDISDDFSFKVRPLIETTPWALANNKSSFGLKLAFQIQ